MHREPLKSWAEMRAADDAAIRSAAVLEASRLYQADLEAARWTREHTDDYGLDAEHRPDAEAAHAAETHVSRSYLNLLQVSA